MRGGAAAVAAMSSSVTRPAECKTVFTSPECADGLPRDGGLGLRSAELVVSVVALGARRLACFRRRRRHAQEGVRGTLTEPRARRRHPRHQERAPIQAPAVDGNTRCWLATRRGPRRPRLCRVASARGTDAVALTDLFRPHRLRAARLDAARQPGVGVAAGATPTIRRTRRRAAGVELDTAASPSVRRHWPVVGRSTTDPDTDPNTLHLWVKCSVTSAFSSPPPTEVAVKRPPQHVSSGWLSVRLPASNVSILGARPNERGGIHSSPARPK